MASNSKLKTQNSKLPSALTSLALAKCVKPKELDAARDAASVGSHEIDELVRLRGTLVVNPDVPGGEAREADGAFDPWVLLSIATKSKAVPSLEVLAKAAAAADPVAGRKSGELLQRWFSLQASTLLPKTVVPGSAGRRGSVSFHGSVTTV